MIFFAWLTATVLIAFYRSSLIIALTSEARIPFEDLLQGLGRWDWNPGARFNGSIIIFKYGMLATQCVPQSFAKVNSYCWISD